MTLATIDEINPTDWDFFDNTPLSVILPNQGAFADLIAVQDMSLSAEERDIIQSRITARNALVQDRLDLAEASLQEGEAQASLEGRNVVQVRAQFGHGNPPEWNGPVKDCARSSGKTTIAALSILTGAVLSCFPLTAPAGGWLLVSGALISKFA